MCASHHILSWECTTLALGEVAVAGKGGGLQGVLCVWGGNGQSSGGEGETGADDGECKNTKDNCNSLLLKASWGSGTALRT